MKPRIAARTWRWVLVLGLLSVPAIAQSPAGVRVPPVSSQRPEPKLPEPPTGAGATARPAVQTTQPAVKTGVTQRESFRFDAGMDSDRFQFSAPAPRLNSVGSRRR